MPRPDGKVALITGAGTGIVRATARAKAANGAKVVVAEIDAAAGEQTAQIVSQAGGSCIAVTTACLIVLSSRSRVALCISERLRRKAIWSFVTNAHYQLPEAVDVYRPIEVPKRPSRFG